MTKKLDINQIVVSSNAILEWLILASVSIEGVIEFDDQNRNLVDEDRYIILGYIVVVMPVELTCLFRDS